MVIGGGSKLTLNVFWVEIGPKVASRDLHMTRRCWWLPTTLSKAQTRDSHTPRPQDKISSPCQSTEFHARQCFVVFQSFFIRCTKENTPGFSCMSGGGCDVTHANRLRCQSCRYNKCLAIGMNRRSKYTNFCQLDTEGLPSINKSALVLDHVFIKEKNIHK